MFEYKVELTYNVSTGYYRAELLGNQHQDQRWEEGYGETPEKALKDLDSQLKETK